MTNIGEWAFGYCSSLTQINIPNSVTSIGESAFSGCTSLTQVNIPNSVTYIGGWAFDDCTSLTQVSIPDSVTSIGSNAFKGCKSLTQINIPNSVTSIGDRVFSWCSSLTQVNIPNSVTSIGEVAFFSCESLTQVSIPNSVTSIGVQAFDYSNALNVIYNMCDEPIECNPYFPDVVLMEATLYVPKGSLAAYEKVDPWRNFWHIEEMDFSGIEDVNSNTNSNITVNNGTIVVNGYAGEVEVFNTSGQLIYRGNDTYISNLNKGIYIVKAGTNVTKVAL